MFHAGAFLEHSLKPSWFQKKQLYNDADGGGTHSLRSVACYIAISEAIERWAFYIASDGPHKIDFAFDIEPSTTGMAAFPGLTKTPARRHAHLEAVERWGVAEWWMGRLPARRLADSTPSKGALEILTPFSDCTISIVWQQCSFGGMSYGFAGGVDIQHAIRHALIEQGRNTNVLGKLFGQGTQSLNNFPLKDLHVNNERRLVFFTSKDGVSLFSQRVEVSCHLKKTLALPRKIVDVEIEGPWTRYATVWRMLYEQSTSDHLNENRNNFFLF